jgi:RNA polymerase sigma-70 factor (ECF subfamily)
VQEGLRELYERYAPAVYRRALKMTGNSSDAWDVVQEVFRALLKRPDAFRSEARPMTYLYRITTNVALNFLRQRAREIREEPTVADEATSPQHVEARDFLRALSKRLDERALQVAALYFIDGLPQEEIAQILDLSRKTIGRELELIRGCAHELVFRLPTEVT